VLSVCPVCGQTVRWIRMPLGTEQGVDQGDIVLDGDPDLTAEGAQQPHFCSLRTPASIQTASHVYCGQTAGWIRMPLGRHRPRPRRHCVRRGPAPPTQKGAQQPHLSAHVYCGQTAEWIRIQLGTDVSLGPGDIVSDGDQATPRKGAQLTPPFGLLCCGTVAHFSNC